MRKKIKVICVGAISHYHDYIVPNYILKLQEKINKRQEEIKCMTTQPIILKQNKMTKINMHEMMNKYNAK